MTKNSGDGSENGKDRSPFPLIMKWLREANFVSAVVAGLTYALARPAFYAFLVVFIGGLFWEAWCEARGSQRVNGPMARIVRKIIRLGRGSTVRRALAGSLLVVIAAPFAAWLGWAAADDAWGGPSTMGGDVNIAVATYRDLGSSGVGVSTESEQLTIRLVDSLRHRLASQMGDKSVEIRRIHTAIEGESEAAAIGNEVGANLVVYGEISRLGDSILVTPRYLLTGKASRELTTDDLAELAGESGLGEGIVQMEVNDLIPGSQALSERCEIVVRFAVALVSMLSGEDEAVHIFRETLELAEKAGLPDNEVLHFFLGKALSASGTTEAYRSALPEFEAAVRINPDYARPYIGIGNWYYTAGADARDPALLHQAAEIYAQAISVSPGSSNPLPRAKAHLGRGNVYFILAQLVGIEYVQLAADEYEAVVDLNAPCSGGLGWWDPRAWGPWDTHFHKSPPYCDEMSKMARIAEEWRDSLAELTPTPPAPTPTPTPTPTPPAPTPTPTPPSLTVPPTWTPPPRAPTVPAGQGTKAPALSPTLPSPTPEGTPPPVPAPTPPPTPGLIVPMPLPPTGAGSTLRNAAPGSSWPWWPLMIAGVATGTAGVLLAYKRWEAKP